MKLKFKKSLSLNLKNFFISILCLSLFSGCDLFKKKENETIAGEQEKPLARVYSKFLYLKDIEGIQGKNYSKKDSAYLIQNYIDTWILKELMLIKAEAQIGEMDEEIENKILDCRNTLLIHEFEKGYLDKTIDTSISEKDIKNYYDAYISTFELKQNIVKGFFIKVPKNAPKLEKLRALLHSSKEKDIVELMSYCVRFADSYIVKDSIWTNFDALIKNTPFASISDKTDFLEKNNFSEISDEFYFYFLKINDYKSSKQISPFEFVKDKIRNTLVNRRRIELINELKLNIYKEAQSNKDFEIYSEK